MAENETSEFQINEELLEVVVRKAVNVIKLSDQWSSKKAKALNFLTNFRDFEESIMGVVYKLKLTSIYWLIQLNQCDFEPAKTNVMRVSSQKNLTQTILLSGCAELLNNDNYKPQKEIFTKGYASYCYLLRTLGIHSYTDDFKEVSEIIKAQSGGELIR